MYKNQMSLIKTFVGLV